MMIAPHERAKVNVIDLLVVMALFSLIPLGFLGYKLLARKPGPPIPITIEMPCFFVKVPDTTLSQIKAGDKAFDKKGNQIGFITSLGEAQPYKYTLQVGDRDAYEVRASGLNKVSATLRLNASIIDNQLYYNDKRLVNDKELLFSTPGYTLLAIPVMTNQDTWVTVTVRFVTSTPETSLLMNEGHLEKNQNGLIIGKLKKILKTEPSTLNIISDDGNKVLTKLDPNRNDVIATLELLCKEKDGSLYFNDYPVKIGSQIVFNTAKLSLRGTLVDVNDRCSP